MGLKVISNGKSLFENFETHDILLMFLNPWYLMEVLKTHSILQRFLNPLYLIGVLKSFS